LFYASTIRELFREFAAARLRRLDEENSRITLAWHGVRIYAQAMHDKRVPKLTRLLIREGPERPQSAKQLVSALHVLSQQYGIPLRKARASERHG
jgi:hypothetical protein